MAIVSIATLKGYFETGDIPTQSNFEDLIDTLYRQDADGNIVIGTFDKQGQAHYDNVTIGACIGGSTYAYYGSVAINGTIDQNNVFFVGLGGSNVARFTMPAIAGYTSLAIFDYNAAAIMDVKVGANDSGGAGFRMLRVSNVQ